MARDEGFAVADTDTGKLNDPKFRKLWRLLRDEAGMNAAVTLYEATQLASWARGVRVTTEDAAPFWSSDVTTPSGALQRAGLLDRSHRIPRKTWDSWFGKAYARRQKRRDAGELGGRPPKHDQTEPKPNGSQSESPANPVPTVPSVPTESESGAKTRAPGARGTGLRPIGAVIEGMRR